MMTKLSQLLKDKFLLDVAIRKERVRLIRMAVALEEPKSMTIKSWIADMEKMIHFLNTDYPLFDELLDSLEDKLDM